MKSRYLLPAYVLASALLLDQATKKIAVAALGIGESIWILPKVVGVRRLHNPAGAFSWLSGLDPAYRSPLLVLLPLAVLAGVLFLLCRLDQRDRKLAVALALVAGGALGNLLDRAVQGFVVDFLRFGRARLPVYNVADLCIFAGAALLVACIAVRAIGSAFAVSTRTRAAP